MALRLAARFSTAVKLHAAVATKLRRNQCASLSTSSRKLIIWDAIEERAKNLPITAKPGDKMQIGNRWQVSRPKIRVVTAETTRK
jgi:hypothetical protein